MKEIFEHGAVSDATRASSPLIERSELRKGGSDGDYRKPPSDKVPCGR